MNVNKLNGWQRIWILLSSTFVVVYFFIFYILPVGFNKTYSYVLPYPFDIHYENLDFPSYSQRYSIKSQMMGQTPVYFEAMASRKEWMEDKYPKISSNLLNKTFEFDKFDEKCFGNNSIDLVYRGNGVFVPTIFKIYHFSYLRDEYVWENLKALPPLQADSKSCWIGIQLRTEDDKQFLYFYRPFNLATNEETIEIAEYLKGKATALLLYQKFFWVIKFIGISLLFSIFLYSLGLLTKWLVQGFKS
jgi:hypothetical protein